MNTVIDRCVLLFLCLPEMFLIKMDETLVIAFFGALIVAALNDVIFDIRFIIFSLTLYCVCLFHLPQLLLFLPIVAYDFPSFYSVKGKGCLKYLRHLPVLCGLAAFFHYINDRTHFIETMGTESSHIFACLFLWIIFGCALAVLFRLRTARYETLASSYWRARNDDKEMQLLLEERNHALQEQQNSEIYNATLKERNRIAREIHDNVGHMLTRSILMVGALKVINKEISIQEPLEQLNTTLNQAMDSIRKSVHDLRDSSVNLEESLRLLASEFTFCPVILNFDTSTDLSKDVKYSFISIVKEALVNIARHSNASVANITVVEHPGFYQLIIQDNGTDFGACPESAADEASDGMGLQNIRSRVKALNGNIQITNTEGFRIYITVPRQMC